MKSSLIALICLASVFGSLALGFGVGVRYGAYAGQLVGAPMRGGFAAVALTKIKDGDTKGSILMYEAEVNRGLLSLNELAESPFLRFVASLLAVGPRSPEGASVLHSYAVKMADYRKVNPSPFKGLYLTHDPDETAEQGAFIDEALQRRRENDQVIGLMVARYASK